MTDEFNHISVMPELLINGLEIINGGHYLDATLGGGGHTQRILEAFPDIRVTGLDRDEIALTATEKRLKPYANRLRLIHTNFADYSPQNEEFDGIIADLGVSSPQLDNPERGFSFKSESPLDMRMDRSQSLTAKMIINHWKEADLAKIFFEYGEERLSRRIAKAIIQNRPLHTTTDLSELIWNNVPVSYRHGRIHPATRVFQALRIAVNQELESLEVFLNKSPAWLKTEGKIGIISFHSLEDRIIKHRFREHPSLTVITKKPLLPSDRECQNNPRARSAKLRFAQKIPIV